MVNLKVFNMVKRRNGSETFISHVTVDVNLMLENVTPEKNGTMMYVSVSVKYQCNIEHMDKIMSGT